MAAERVQHSIEQKRKDMHSKSTSIEDDDDDEGECNERYDRFDSVTQPMFV
jgi:hypothetical protein